MLWCLSLTGWISNFKRQKSKATIQPPTHPKNKSQEVNGPCPQSGYSCFFSPKMSPNLTPICPHQAESTLAQNLLSGQTTSCSASTTGGENAWEIPTPSQRCWEEWRKDCKEPDHLLTTFSQFKLFSLNTHFPPAPCSCRSLLLFF